MRESEDPEVAETLKDPVLEKGDGDGVCLKEEEAVFRVNPGNGDEEVEEEVAGLCKGVTGALMLPLA